MNNFKKQQSQIEYEITFNGAAFGGKSAHVDFCLQVNAESFEEAIASALNSINETDEVFIKSVRRH